MRLLLLTLLTILLAGCAQPELSKEMRQAVECAKKSQYAEAIQHTSVCLEYAPEMTDAILLHNYCTFLVESRESARRQALYNLSKTTQTAPERFDTWLFYGWVLVESGKYRDAIPPLEKASALLPANSPHRPRVQLLLGRCYVTNNLQSKALPILQTLQGRKPYRDWPELYNCLGLLALQRQNTALAVSFFQRGLQTDPANEALLQNLAVTYDLYRNDAVNARKTYIDCLVQKKVSQDNDGIRKISVRLRKLGKR